MVKKIALALGWFVGLIVVLAAIGGWENDMFDTFQFFVRMLAGGGIMFLTSYHIGRC